MADQDIKMLIERIMAEARTHQSARFSNEIYADEPILKTGRQMQNFLPDQYRKMREISRWQDDPKGGAGRWLSEAELFYRQGLLMADFEDDCPYNGTFKSYFPTYNAMSDRQLRGYFTWRAQVRRGTVEETSTSFAFLYLYELICGIGVDDPLDGFNKIKAFWDVYRAFEPGIDRFARVWLQDYAVFHGLDPKLLRDSKTVMFDNALIELRRAARDLVPAPAPSGQTPKRRKTSEPTLPFPPDEVREERLMTAINALSTYNLSNSRLDRSHHRDLRHVACAVYVRMARYYDTHRKTGIVASLFGEETAMPYTMFASAVFFAPERHEDCEYRLDPIHIYRCQNGFWECMRIHGSRQKSSKLGEMMRACDQRLRLALDPAHPLKEEKVPKYLAKII
ncbi:TerB N-terminal domain-containing protein, partial [Collinsella aerofaciens]